ncbi:MAG: hypothetical protein E6K81_13095 [Candidatus Eisenbacteria bacterium]|uniref:Uncharacterized protein n=1 Tax=Eiseniibacteriota bacterium TaxID=2212470 RepID=A0A538U2X2_UNCEI|nr:MAG: hypothetical protein E6K81_13095 [Candidatus Eisenbacteria bacterium]
MSYLVYYPLLWFLRRTRGLEPLHASALDADAGGVLIGGAPVREPGAHRRHLRLRVLRADPPR